MITININNIEYSGFISVKVSLGVEICTPIFSIIVEGNENISFIEGDSIEILVDDNKIITGIIEYKSSLYNIKSYIISIKGRGKTGILVSSAASNTSINGVTFKRLCEIEANIVDIEVVNLVDDLSIKPIYASPEIGQSIFDFIESFARKNQVLLFGDNLGRLTISRASKELYPYVLKLDHNNEGNNILSSHKIINLTELYGKYRFHSQLSPLTNASSNDISSQYGESIDLNLPQNKIFETYSEESLTSSELKKRAEWEKSLRRARNNVYICIVNNHSMENVLFVHNTLYEIYDTIQNISRILYCKYITYKQDENGNSTEFEFVDDNSYTIDDKPYKGFL